MDAVAYWRQFVVPFYFDKPQDKLVARVVHLGEEKGRDGDWIPKLRMATEDGRTYIVTAHQARLKAELVREAPAVGDIVTIVYEGEAERAAPGMNKAKEFAVTVRRSKPDPGPGAGPVRGSGGPENGLGVGRKAP
jgi:hypothetical protein